MKYSFDKRRKTPYDKSVFSLKKNAVLNLDVVLLYFLPLYLNTQLNI